MALIEHMESYIDLFKASRMLSQVPACLRGDWQAYIINLQKEACSTPWHLLEPTRATRSHLDYAKSGSPLKKSWHSPSSFHQCHFVIMVWWKDKQNKTWQQSEGMIYRLEC